MHGGDQEPKKGEMKKSKINHFIQHQRMTTRQDLESYTKDDLVELVLKLQASSNTNQDNNRNKRKFDQLENSPEKPVSLKPMGRPVYNIIS